jgi:hypothetical protein
MRAAGADGSLIGVPGANPAGNNLTLKGWPLTVSSSHHSLTGILSYKLGASLNTAPSFFFCFYDVLPFDYNFSGLRPA